MTEEYVPLSAEELDAEDPSIWESLLLGRLFATIAADREYIASSEIVKDALHATIESSETRIAALEAALREMRPLMIKPSDTGRRRKAVAARADTLLSTSKPL